MTKIEDFDWKRPGSSYETASHQTGSILSGRNDKKPILCRIVRNICLTSLTRAKCGVRSTLCWKIPNISGSIELFAL